MCQSCCLISWIAGSKDVIFDVDLFICSFFYVATTWKVLMVDAVSELIAKYGLEDYVEIYLFCIDAILNGHYGTGLNT